MKLSLVGNGESSGRVAESARPVRIVMVDIRSGAKRNPREKRNSSFVPSVELLSRILGIGGAIGGIVGLLIRAALLRSRDLDRDRLDDFLGALMLMEIRFSRSARSVSRSTMMAGPCMRPFGILIGAGGLRLVDGSFGRLMTGTD